MKKKRRPKLGKHAAVEKPLPKRIQFGPIELRPSELIDGGYTSPCQRVTIRGNVAAQWLACFGHDVKGGMLKVQTDWRHARPEAAAKELWKLMCDFELEHLLSMEEYN